MAVLPTGLRRLAPARLRDDVRVRALLVGAGLIPPRAMHSADDMAVLLDAARGRRRVVEIGVYEGGSAVELVRALGQEAELHLIDPFGRQPWALPAGWGATEGASRRVVARAARGGRGPRVTWHVDRSDAVAGRWTAGPVDLVFVDGDHSEAGVELDWRLWHPLVAVGGAVVFHDARLSQPGGRGLPGPTAVVDRLLRGGAAPPGWAIAREADRTVLAVRSA